MWSFSIKLSEFVVQWLHAESSTFCGGAVTYHLLCLLISSSQAITVELCDNGSEVKTAVQQLYRILFLFVDRITRKNLVLQYEHIQ